MMRVKAAASFVTPAQAAVHGDRLVGCPWIPAFAGMTNNERRR